MDHVDNESEPCRMCILVQKLRDNEEMSLEELVDVLVFLVTLNNEE